jgi:uncharacterized membrane protein
MFRDDLLSVGVTAAEIAWPIVLALCVGLMVFPFVFLYLAKRGGPEPTEEEAAMTERQ